jgi:serine/threonine protein kinase
MPEPAAPVPAELRVLADRYELGDLVGRGGMAEVYRAHDRLLGRTVAVKVFRPNGDPVAQQRFHDEGIALARLGHPALVSIYDVGNVGDRSFLVMEFVEGESLQSRLLSGPLPHDQVLRIGAALAEALAHAHERGVVHRDVKPSNIMLDRDGVPHLTDFGIALLDDSPRLTSASEMIGTPAYLAPEQVTNVEVGPGADVYALALVLLECVTGQPAYPADSSLQAALARLTGPPRIPADLPSAFADLLRSMTSTDATARPSAAECALWLLPEQLPAPLPLEDAPVSPLANANRTILLRRPTPRVANRARSRWRPVAASVAGVAAVLVAGVLLLNSQQSPTGHPLTGGGQAYGAGGAATSQPPAAGGATAPAGPARPVGTLVANEQSVSARETAPSPATSSPTEQTTPVTPSAPVTTTPAPPQTSSSSPTPTTTPPPTTTTTPPPTTTNASGTG